MDGQYHGVAFPRARDLEPFHAGHFERQGLAARGDDASTFRPFVPRTVPRRFPRQRTWPLITLAVFAFLMAALSLAVLVMVPADTPAFGATLQIDATR